MRRKWAIVGTREMSPLLEIRREIRKLCVEFFAEGTFPCHGRSAERISVWYWRNSVEGSLCEDESVLSSCDPGVYAHRTAGGRGDHRAARGHPSAVAG